MTRDKSIRTIQSDLRWVWPGALACFVLAGTTGALYRFGLLYGLPAGLHLTNVRHAHSHLMYLGWATPLLMALIATWLPTQTKRPLPQSASWVIGATLVLALASYPAFLAYGYEPVQFGASRLPLAAVLASFNILAWYLFVVVYVRATWRVGRTRVLLLWDAALATLILASFGAWGRGLLMGLGLDDPFLSAATVHLFLDLFAEGWFVLALLGLLYVGRPTALQTLSCWGTRLLVAGLPLIFLLSVPAGLMAPWLRFLAGVGGVTVAIGLLLHVAALWPRTELLWWRVPLAFLALKAVAEFAGSAPPVMEWALRAGLRIPYLHVLLLGFVSLGLFAAARDVWGPVLVRGHRWMIVATLLLLASLIPLTGLWPGAWDGRWTLLSAAWAALAPIVAATITFFQCWTSTGERATIHGVVSERV